MTTVCHLPSFDTIARRPVEEVVQGTYLPSIGKPLARSPKSGLPRRGLQASLEVLLLAGTEEGSRRRIRCQQALARHGFGRRRRLRRSPSRHGQSPVVPSPSEPLLPLPIVHAPEPAPDRLTYTHQQAFGHLRFSSLRARRIHAARSQQNAPDPAARPTPHDVDLQAGESLQSDSRASLGPHADPSSSSFAPLQEAHKCVPVSRPLARSRSELRSTRPSPTLPISRLTLPPFPPSRLLVIPGPIEVTDKGSSCCSHRLPQAALVLTAPANTRWQSFSPMPTLRSPTPRLPSRPSSATVRPPISVDFQSSSADRTTPAFFGSSLQAYACSARYCTHPRPSPSSLPAVAHSAGTWSPPTWSSRVRRRSSSTGALGRLRRR